MMSEKEFEARLTHIEDEAAARQEKVDGYRDQAMAKLFVASEWSQGDLAANLTERWGRDVSPDWVSKHLRLGRFLSFFNTSGIESSVPGSQFCLPTNLTERAFR